MNLKQKEASTRKMENKKRKREEAAGGSSSALGADQPKPKRVKNKEKYLPKGNKARKRAAAQLMNGANAIPVQERVRDVPESAAEGGAPAAAAAAEATEGSKPGEDFFVIDTTPMNPAEVAEKKKSKGQIKRERQAAKEGEHHSAESLADKEARKEKKRKEARERKERNDKKKAQRRQEKKEKKAKKKEMKQQEESRKRKGRKAREEKMDEDEKEKEEETSSSSESDSDSDSSSDSSSSSGSESEIEVKKTSTPKADKKSEKKEKPAAKGAKQEEQATNKNRFIVFVGNLPYTATTETVTAHFSKIAPISVRVATDKKDSDKCRGFGFVEFEAFDRMQTCLKLYHHSSFDDGKSPARKINVELTAGGGGKSETRRTKLKEKNQKLAEERAKNAQEEKKKKGEKESKGGEEEGGEFSGIHPSRLNQMR